MARNSTGLTGYATVVAISASDTVPIATGPTDALLVTTAGNATVVDASGNSVALVAIPAGTVIPAKFIRVNSTGLTAVLFACYY